MKSTQNLQKTPAPKPIQAGDYGLHDMPDTDVETPPKSQETDGRKTLALWS